MEEQTKLISCIDGEGHERKFIIQKNVILGTGAFGVVKKAHQHTKQNQELAVKIVPIDNQRSKENIIQEVQILKNLPPNENLVSIIPLKCFSINNFYIFMEYCNEGTLADQIKSKAKPTLNFTEQQVFKAFYQILHGYKALYGLGILHQDLKPENILIKNETYKITDFGFSIFYEGVKLDSVRKGTCEYIPLQKLTQKDYFATTKSDVFALGVIFFKMITGKHPYLLKKIVDYKDYISQLNQNPLSIPSHLKSKMSIPMQDLFDLILRMVAKYQKNRCSFDEIYKFITDQEIFLQYINKLEQKKNKNNSSISQNNMVIKFVQYSKAFVIPFSIPKNQQQQYQKLVNKHLLNLDLKQKKQSIQKIQSHLCSMRIMAYFFDKLNRILIVQKEKRQIQKIQLQKLTEIQENTMLTLIYTSLKIVNLILQDIRLSRVMPKEQWLIYKKAMPNSGLIKIIEKDQYYLTLLKNQLLFETKQSKMKDRRLIIEQSNKPLLQFLTETVKPQLLALLEIRSNFIQIDNKKQLDILYIIIYAIEIINHFQQTKNNWQELDGFFRKVDQMSIDYLRQVVTQKLTIYELSFAIDQGDFDNQEFS